MSHAIYQITYEAALERCTAHQERDAAMSHVVGGQYREIGLLEKSALTTLGLSRSHTLLDVGCGSGRLAFALKDFLEGTYVGTDPLAEALEFARRKAGRSDWRFLQTTGERLPTQRDGFDFIAFFSVFTHLLDEDIYRYLRNAKERLKPGGRIVFSFLDLSVPSHWPVFASTVADENPVRVINRFLSKDTLRHWFVSLGLTEIRIYDGPEKWVHLSEPFSYEDGRRAEGVVEFGQSVAVVTREGEA